MPVQTTYNETISPARAGQIANTEPSVLISRAVEDEAGIGFGVAVAQGEDDNGCVAFAGEGYMGVTVRERSVRPETPNAFAQRESARIMTKGVIWVEAGAAVEAGDAVYVTADGTFTSAEDDGGDPATEHTAIPNARFDSSADEGGLVKLRLA